MDILFQLWNSFSVTWCTKICKGYEEKLTSYIEKQKNDKHNKMTADKM